MASSSTPSVTRLLLEWRGGDSKALDRLFPLVYDELREQAGRYMRNERPDHTLQATAVVHEAYGKLVRMERVSWVDRAHFLAVAATCMRRILVDHARAYRRAKRGGGDSKLSLDESALITPEPSLEVLALDEALDRLAEFDEKKARAVELHHFGGLTYEETAAALGISPASVHRELRLARAWLYEQLGGSGRDGR